MAAIAPPLVILAYGATKITGSWKPEAVWSAFFLGAFGTFGALGIELAVKQLGFSAGSYPVVTSATTAVFAAAIPEESIKFFVLVVLAEKHVDVRRLQDVIVLGLAVSLGFATLENFLYVISNDDWKTIAALRAITAVPGHGLDGLAMGALLVSARLNGIKESGIKEIWSAKYALIVPVLLHAAYDFPLLAIEQKVARPWFGVSWIVVLVLSSVFVIRLFNQVLAKARFADLTSSHDVASSEAIKSLMSRGAIGLIVPRQLPPALAAIDESSPALKRRH
jgi:RsiW-degrading membrane proteinase PrsW (M82 family)